MKYINKHNEYEIGKNLNLKTTTTPTTMASRQNKENTIQIKRIPITPFKNQKANAAWPRLKLRVIRLQN